MQVHFELTKRLAEMAGFPSVDIEVSPSGTLGDALDSLVNRFAPAGAEALVTDGQLIPSILVVLNGAACSPDDLGRALGENSSIDLLLPIAGG